MNITPISPNRAIPQITDALQDKQSVMLWGPAGCAKSDVARLIAAQAFDGQLIDIRLSHKEPADMHLPVPDMQRRIVEWFPTEELPSEARHGAKGVLFLDEITSAPPASAAVGYQICNDRRLGTHLIPDGWGILAAGNRQGDRGITYSMASPLANRFVHFLFDPSHMDTRDEWVKDYAIYCAEHGSNPMVSAFIQFSPDSLYQAPKAGDVAFPSLRSWTRLASACDRYESRNEPVPAETVTGRIGKVVGESFLAFMAHKDEVPTFAEIVADPIRTKCPSVKNLGACFFVVGMLCHNTTADNFNSVSKYLARLPNEIDAAAVGLLKQETRSKVLMTRAGQDWLVRVQDILA